jgi:hypothetical protein
VLDIGVSLGRGVLEFSCQHEPGGIGDIDYWKASYWKGFVGVTVRTYDPKTGLCRIYWVDNTFSGGIIQPPVVGKFNGNVGIFEGPAEIAFAYAKSTEALMGEN